MSTAPYIAVRVEGGLFTGDLLERVTAAAGDLPGNRPEDYHLAAGERLGEAASRKWEYLLGAYQSFKDRIALLPESDAATSETRERWLQLLVGELGYGRVPFVRGGLTADGKSFPISHLWEHVPMHLVGWNVELDRRIGGGESRRAPQSMLQDFLNRSDDHLWGVLSNGRLLRILRDSTALVGSAYVEFDLEAIFDGDLYSEFVLLFAFLHSSRFELLPRDDDNDPTPADCWLERWRTDAIEKGTRARDQLRDGVEQALGELGTGFLEANPRLREDVADGRLTLPEFHHELLRLAYQLIFVFVAEDRSALLEPDPQDAPPEERAARQAARDRYAEYFSTARLRRIASRRRGDRHTDLWRCVVTVLDALGSDEGLPPLALPPLGGLFFRAGDPDAADGRAPDLLRDCTLTNERLLAAVRLLSTVRDSKKRPQRVDYQHLGAEELGSIYESLLELVPATEPGPKFVLRVAPGNDRKTTGSYYTPSSLINVLLDTTLEPLIAKAAENGYHSELLKITVCDPACGSGHFLVAAARRIAKRYAAMYHGEDEPTPAHVRTAMHKVVESCVYGVDINPLAAELAKVSLWLESLEPGRPLAYLDPHIKVGNSLLGVTPALLEKGIPDEAFLPISGDDKKIVAALRRQNAMERPHSADGGQAAFDFGEEIVRVGNRNLADRVGSLAALPTRTLAEIRQQARRFREYERSPELEQRRRVADAWCAAFVWRKHADAPEGITTETLRRIEAGTALSEPVATELTRLAERYQFFHWHLEFPEIFRVQDDDRPDHNPETGWQGGFTCVLGNPPWERVKLQDQEFFASRRPEIALAANASIRKKMIEALEISEDEADRRLSADYEVEVRKSKAWAQMLRQTGRYPKTGQGDINTYAVFAETARTIIGPSGRAGVVLPTSIVTDATPAPFFRDLVERRHLHSVFEFENEEKLFPQVDHRVRFCLLSFTGRREITNIVDLAFRARQVTQLPEKAFQFTPEQFLLVNPNTGTSPVCDSPRNARILIDIYNRIPPLWRENPKENTWGLEFLRMYDMATDSGLFRTHEQLRTDGWTQEENVFIKGDKRMLPLYEGKMVHQFDHRYGTYDGQTTAQAKMGTLPRLTIEQRQDPTITLMPRYWVQEFDTKDEAKSKGGKPKYDLGVASRLDRKGWTKGWLLGWRDMVRSTDDRTVISAAIPRTAVGDKFLLALPTRDGPLLQANLSAFILDYCARQKFAGTSFKYYLIKQLPILNPSLYRQPASWFPRVTIAEWIEARALELTYTAWDMQPYAQDLGDDGPPFVWDDERRFWMRAELDAAYFYLYGVERDDIGYIMDSFRAFRNNDPERFERTKRAILDIYDAIVQAIESGEPYRTVLDPPPGHGQRHPNLG